MRKNVDELAISQVMSFVKTKASRYESPDFAQRLANTSRSPPPKMDNIYESQRGSNIESLNSLRRTTDSLRTGVEPIKRLMDELKDVQSSYERRYRVV